MKKKFLRSSLCLVLSGIVWPGLAFSTTQWIYVIVAVVSFAAAVGFFTFKKVSATLDASTTVGD